jgi:hypothetical protein
MTRTTAAAARGSARSDSLAEATMTRTTAAALRERAESAGESAGESDSETEEATMTRAGTVPDAVPTASDAAPIPSEGDGDGEATMVRIGRPAPPSVTMTRVDPPAAAPPLVAASAASATTASAPAVAVTPATLEVDPTIWSVEPGDSLWSIAEDVTSSSGGPAPTEREVARYWQRLVEANRPHLVDPDNPDLLVPGQQVVVPPTAG